MRPANEKIAPTQHEYVPHTKVADPTAKTGYIEKDYEHQEYPKYVGDKLVKNAEEEATLAPKEEAKEETKASE